jgi:pimeloyl-ACP methyl ester carboxylesterase
MNRGPDVRRGEQGHANRPAVSSTGRQTMSGPSPFKTPAGETRFLAAYDHELRRWPVPYEQVDVHGHFGTTYVVICGPETAPPLLLLHGYLATLTMWWPNIAALSQGHRVYAVDVMGQPGKSRPDEPIRSAADYGSWLTDTLGALHLDRVDLVGMSFGGWLALNYAAAVPQRVRTLILFSPSGLLPMVRQFTLRGMLMVALPRRLTVNAFFRWLGFTMPPYTGLLDIVYLGLTQFRMPLATARIAPTALSDDALRAITVPTLLLIGDHEVISDPVRALERARRLMPVCDGALVPGCRHEMYASRHDIVDARVLTFLTEPLTADRSVMADGAAAASETLEDEAASRPLPHPHHDVTTPASGVTRCAQQT